jgi:hypothetical protein
VAFSGKNNALAGVREEPRNRVRNALRLALPWRKQLLLLLASAPKTKSASPNQASGSVEAERASEPLDFDELFFLRVLFLCERFDLRRSELDTFV